MAQATFHFETPATDIGAGHAGPRPAAGTGNTRPAGRDGTGFEIGWDFARHRLTPPVAHLHAENPVRQGWSAGRAVFGARTLKPTRWVRQWLQLRLAAWQHGVAVEEVQVTPHFLAQLAVSQCPITGQVLADSGPAEGQVRRLNPAAAVAAGNLAMLGPEAAQAAEGCRWSEALSHARHLAAAEQAQPGQEPRLGGLNAAQWARLACLKSLVTPLPHAELVGLPMLVLPPNRLRVLNPVQAVQTMLTLQFCQAGYARRLVALAVLMPSGEARHAFQVFMHTLLARRLAAGPALDPIGARQAMEAAWADALVQRRWQRLAQWLTAADCEQLLQRAHRRGLLGEGRQWLATHQATEGWALASGGQAPTEASSEGVVSTKALSH